MLWEGLDTFHPLGSLGWASKPFSIFDSSHKWHLLNLTPLQLSASREDMWEGVNLFSVVLIGNVTESMCE